MAVEFGSKRETERGLKSGGTEDVGTNEAGEKVDASETNSMVMVPKVSRILEVWVGKSARRKGGADRGVVGGEPSVGVAIAGWRVHTTVKMNDGWDSRCDRGGGYSMVPWEDVAGREVVLPCNVGGNAMQGFYCWARDGGSCLRGAVGENGGWREVPVESPSLFVHADFEVAGRERTFLDAVTLDPRHIRQLVDEHLETGDAGEPIPTC